MRGRFFGCEQTDPCPVCGTPRMLVDWDDVTIVTPEVPLEGCPQCHSSYSRCGMSD